MSGGHFRRRARPPVKGTLWVVGPGEWAGQAKRIAEAIGAPSKNRKGGASPKRRPFFMPRVACGEGTFRTDQAPAASGSFP